LLEGYSDHVQRVVRNATAEARLLAHPRVGTEHLLLGLLADEDDDAAGSLRAAGASLGAARHKVAEAVAGEPDSRPTEALPLTARAQRALERAGRFSRQARAAEVTASHVLLGVLDVEGLACQVLRGLDVDIVRLGDTLAGWPQPRAAASPNDERLRGDGETLRPRCPRCRAELDDTLAETLVAARLDAGLSTDVSVVHCSACGETLGVLRPDWS
jgi:ATP-dependent Clp protease ATP-binding subunit ClpA